MLRLPWYVVLGLSVYCLLHMGLAVEHPCAVLGIASPVNRSSVTRAYRTLSICTHPDKQPRGSEAAYRGGLLFQRATEARKALTDAIKYKDNMDKEAVTVADDGEEGGSEVSCSTGLNAMLVNGAAELVSQLHATWQRGLAAASSRLGMTPAVLEAQILSKRFTIAALCAAPLVLLEGGWLKALVLLLSGLGAAAKLLVSLVLGPLPTLGHLVLLPAIRTCSFLYRDLIPFAVGVRPSVEEEDREAQSRLAAAAAVQFELLLAASKRLVPLLALCCTGTSLPGFWGAIISGQLLRRVRVCPPEVLHLLLVGAGALHTLLGASGTLEGGAAAQMQLQWQPSGRDVLAVAIVALLGATYAAAVGDGREPTFCASFAAGLAMRMAFYDVLSPARGGEKNYMSALLTPLFGQIAEGLRLFAGLEVVGSDAVAVRCGGGVGDCGGGLVRAGQAALDAYHVRVSWTFFGVPAEEVTTAFLAAAVKATLLALPLLAAAQWALRTAQAMSSISAANAQVQGAAAVRKPGKKVSAAETAAARLPQLQQQLFLTACVLTCTLRLLAFVFFYELNGVHSSLGGFLLVALAGCLFEALLSTYALHLGRLPHVAFFALFLLL